MAEKKRRGEKLLDARKMGAIMEKNFTVLRRDMTRMVPLILFPIFMILIFGFTSGNIPKHISTGVIVYDNSPFSQEIQQAIASNEVFSVTHVVSTEGEGRRLLDEGKVHILIEIPQDLQKNLDAGKQASITVIVDESDSSIAAAAHQTLSALIDGIANSLAQKRFAAYQQSVASSSQSLQSYITSQPNAYDAIASHTTVAQNLLVQSYALTDEYAMALHSSLPNPGLVVLSNDFQNPSNTSTQNNIIISEGGSGSAIRAQIALMQKASSLTLSGKEHVQAANSLALQAGERLSNLQEYSAYEKQVSQPLQEIRVFTQSKADNTLTPIVYAEKAAYGTGKRPVDFVIPIIIAITIFQGAVMGMGRAVAGEKREGALTRVFLTPTSNATIIIGTLMFYIFFELFRSAFLIAIAVFIFNIQIEGSIFLMAIILMIYTGVATSLGMILSSMAKSENQYMALSMLLSMPTIFLAGAFFPLQAMPRILQIMAAFLPVTYAGEALRDVMIKGFSVGPITYPLLMLGVFLVGSLAVLFMVFKRDIE